jgi:putative endonuclease
MRCVSKDGRESGRYGPSFETPRRRARLLRMRSEIDSHALRMRLRGAGFVLTYHALAAFLTISRTTAPIEMSEGAYLYIVRCRDGSLYVGTTRSSLETRIAQHNAGTFKGYTMSRRPVELVFSEWFDRITDAIECERMLKGWSRAKKEAFIRGDMASLRELSKRRSTHYSKRSFADTSS